MADGICQGCGKIVKGGRTAPPKRYCSVECRPRCRLDDCDSPQHTRSLCARHAERERITGDPETPLVRQKNTGPCSFQDCDEPMRKSGLCVSHYSQQRAGVPLRPLRRWTPLGSPCLICGSAVPTGKGRRTVCGAACQSALHRLRKYGVTPEEYAAALRDGCTICHRIYDALSVDHDHSCCPGASSCGECVRGFLCRQCNWALGLFRDDPASLVRAAQYLNQELPL